MNLKTILESHSTLFVSYQNNKEDISHPSKIKDKERCMESIPSHGKQQENDLLHQFCSNKDTLLQFFQNIPSKIGVGLYGCESYVHIECTLASVN